MQNPYIPAPVEVVKIVTEVDTKDIKTFRFAFQNKEDEAAFQYLPGQFAELSIFGKGGITDRDRLIADAARLSGIHRPEGGGGDLGPP
jgi:NAD(P)H-flavin reductase